MDINFKSLISNLQTDWKTILLNIYNARKNKMLELQSQIEEDYDKTEGYFDIYPPKELIFNAFNHFNFNDLKIVIIGQDPYHGEGQAMGLSFSVNDGIKVPPSLKNIYKEIKTDYPNFEIPKHGNLINWVEQGVLLLNATLTVKQSKPNSHQKIWDKTKFTDEIIKYISQNSKDSVIFMLWGNFAKKKSQLIDNEKHHILESGHPSPLSIKSFQGCGHFKKANDILENELNKKKIDW